MANFSTAVRSTRIGGDLTMDSPEDATPTCRVCGLGIEMRHPVGGSSKNLVRWVHEETVAGEGAEKDHDAVR